MTGRSTDSGAPVIDLETLENLARDAGAEAMPSLLASFVRDCTKRETEIIAATERKDLITLEAQSHALTSSAQTFGALTLADLTRRIERSCQDGFAETALSQAADVPELAAAVRLEMTAQINRFENDNPTN